MKKHTILLAILVLGLTLFAQEIQEQAVSINIEVPVRVYKGNDFVDGLTIKDFEVYEDGILQEVEAVYLINKRNIQSKEEKQLSTPETSSSFKPETSRSFYLVFEVVEYTPKLNEAIDYFYQNVMEPQDNLTIITPSKTYSMKSELLSKLSTEQIIQQLSGLLRKDAWSASSEYRRLKDDLTDLIISINSKLNIAVGNSRRRYRYMGSKPGSAYAQVTVDEEENPIRVEMERYEEIMQRIESIRTIDQKSLLDFANILKEKEGQKYVFLFYQREFIPQISSRAFNKIQLKMIL